MQKTTKNDQNHNQNNNLKTAIQAFTAHDLETQVSRKKRFRKKYELPYSIRQLVGGS